MKDTVLIVDDSLTVRMDLSEAFESAGLDVTCCATLAEARESLAARQSDVVVLDVLLPDGNGVELLAELRTRAGAQPVILMLSTAAEVEDRVRGLETGADEYVGKPYDSDYVVARARQLLALRSPLARPQPQARQTLLVIDDSLTVREEVCEALEGAGYGVITADNGEDGLRLAASRRPAAVVVDGHLPGIDGATVIRRIRLDASLRSVPCILLTGSQERSRELATLDAGADAFVHKDDPRDVLLARLAAVLRGRVPDQVRPSLLGPQKVMAVDDSPTFLYEIAAALRGEGLDVATARSGEEALRLLAIQSVDCILLDMVMPGMGGTETCRRIKSTSAVADIPIIMLTSRDDHASMMEGFAAGADDYVSKVSELEVVKARVRVQLRRKQFEDEKRRFHAEIIDKEMEASEARAARELADARNLLIQELETKNEELKVANQLKRDFLANMSHEIRTPLNAILGLTHLALRTDMTPRQRNYLHDIHNAGQTLRAIVNDILDFSKAEAGRVELERIDVWIDDVLQSLSSLVGRDAADKGIDLLMTTAPDVPPVVVGDPLRLGQILLNLVGNAVKFTPKGEILISVSLVETQADTVTLRFSIKDTGVGMTEQERSRLFGAFSQADTSTTRKYGGTGLGLAISQRMVELMHGAISVESAPGEGSCFSFTARFGKSDAPRPFPSPALDGLRALVIDRNRTRREILCSGLGTLTVNALSCEALEEALTEIHTDRPTADIIFVDAQMTPGEAGLQRLRHLPTAPGSLPGSPFVILVDDERAQDNPDPSHRAAHAVVARPITLSRLHDAILNVLGRGGMRRRYEPANRNLLNESMEAVRGGHLLLAEDNSINQQIARELLESAGVTVDIVSNGRQAVDRLLSCGPHPRWDAILMDLQMPEMDGYEATRLIRKDARFRNLPILAMTAHVLIEERDKCQEAGMVDYIAKPIDPEAFFATLGRWIPVRPNAAKLVETRGFPTIEGVNVPEGLLRVAGNLWLYRTLLLDLAAQHEQTAAALNDALARGDYVMVEHLAHTLKGLTGNLGIESLSDLSSQVESLARHGRTVQCIEQAALLIDTLGDLCLRIQNELPEQRPSPVPPGEGVVSDPEKLHLAITRLKASLERHDGASIERLNDVLIELSPLAPAERLDSLAQHVNQFAFEAAQTELKALAEHYDQAKNR